MALLLPHSRKLPRVPGVLNSERGSIVRHCSARACSSLVKEDGVSSSNLHGEYGTRIGGSSFFQDRQPGKELQMFKFSLQEPRGSYTSKRASKYGMPISVAGINSLFSCGAGSSSKTFFKWHRFAWWDASALPYHD